MFLFRSALSLVSALANAICGAKLNVSGFLWEEIPTFDAEFQSFQKAMRHAEALAAGIRC
jgi:hypothetical protein